jgi:ABC-type transport system involved in cytochrome bd biosynthesis fused ATPase/permease subunit
MLVSQRASARKIRHKVGERGVTSQSAPRLAIARAIVTNAPASMFGNATSALEAESGRLGLPSLDRMAGQRTIIVTPHRHRARGAPYRCDGNSRSVEKFAFGLTRQPDYQSCN